MHRTTPPSARLTERRVAAPAARRAPVPPATHVTIGTSRRGEGIGIDPLLTPLEVAQIFRVDPKTVTRWANAGKITTVRTLGGHRRFSEREIRTLLAVVPTQNPLEA